MFIYLCRYSIGCAISAPDGSSPRGYGRVHAVDHRLKNYFKPKLYSSESPFLCFSLLVVLDTFSFAFAHDVIADDDGVFEFLNRCSDVTCHEWTHHTLTTARRRLRYLI